MTPVLRTLACALVSAVALTAVPAPAADGDATAAPGGFECVFSDSTIRLDYILTGTAASPQTALAHTLTWPGWAGRRGSLDTYPLHGNVRLTAIQGTDTVFVTAMSTLYNEWLETGDTIARAHECTVLMPRPHSPVDITLTVYDSRRRPLSVHRHRLDPADILIRRAQPAGYPVTPIHTGTYNGHRIKVAFLPEGFTAAQMDSFHIYARRAAEAILEHEPFSTYRDRFDFTAVDIPSAESDVSHPLTADWRRTAFSSHFSTFYSDRYLTVPAVFGLHDALAALPYEHIIVLANTDVYGGGGIFNSYTVTNTGNPQFKPVVVHEFGHSFGGLADEYFYDDDVMTDTYPTDVEPWEPNVTTLVDFKGKWENLLGADQKVVTAADQAAARGDSAAVVSAWPEVGLFEGAAYSARGVYRPADRCRMRVNDIDRFCPACRQALTRLILFYTH